MAASIVIDKAGRIVLPSEIRRRLNLAPGSRLRLEIAAECIELTPGIALALEPVGDIK